MLDELIARTTVFIIEGALSLINFVTPCLFCQRCKRAPSGSDLADETKVFIARQVVPAISWHVNIARESITWFQIFVRNSRFLSSRRDNKLEDRGRGPRRSPRSRGGARRPIARVIKKILRWWSSSARGVYEKPTLFSFYYRCFSAERGCDTLRNAENENGDFDDVRPIRWTRREENGQLYKQRTTIDEIKCIISLFTFTYFINIHFYLLYLYFAIFY